MSNSENPRAKFVHFKHTPAVESWMKHPVEILKVTISQIGLKNSKISIQATLTFEFLHLLPKSTLKAFRFHITVYQFLQSLLFNLPQKIFPIF